MGHVNGPAQIAVADHLEWWGVATSPWLTADSWYIAVPLDRDDAISKVLGRVPAVPRVTLYETGPRLVVETQVHALRAVSPEDAALEKQPWWELREALED